MEEAPVGRDLWLFSLDVGPFSMKSEQHFYVELRRKGDSAYCQSRKIKAKPVIFNWGTVRMFETQNT